MFKYIENSILADLVAGLLERSFTDKYKLDKQQLTSFYDDISLVFTRSFIVVTMVYIFVNEGCVIYTGPVTVLCTPILLNFDLAL